MVSRGALIVIEGLDRSGKSTQAARLLDWLASQNTPTELIKFPDRTTPIGQMIDAYLRSQSELDDRAVHLLFSANRWELVPRINALLSSGTTVLCDRYAFSGAAFTAAKPNAPPRAWCRAPDAGLPAPDLTLFFDISPEVARARGGYGEERYEKEEMQRKVREEFTVIREKVKEVDGRWVIVDAGKSVEEVEEDVRSLVRPLVKGLETPLHILWRDEVQ